MDELFSQFDQDLTANRGPRLLVTIIVLGVITNVAVILRLWSRRALRIPLGPDDYTILLSLALYWGLSIVGLIALDQGFGRHSLSIGVKKVQVNIKAVFAYEILCTLCIFVYKISILFFYRRVFPTETFLRIVNVLIVLLAIMTIVLTGTFFFQCQPLRFLWDRSIPGGSCFKIKVYFRSLTLINLVCDCVVLALPLPVVWSLTISLHQKLAISAMFLAGVFTCIAGLFRYVVVGAYVQSDLTWTLLETAAWTYAEACLGILTASLPMIRPLYKRWRGHPVTLGKSRDPSAISGTLNSINNPSRSAWPRRTSSTNALNSTFVEVKATGPFTRLVESDRDIDLEQQLHNPQRRPTGGRGLERQRPPAVYIPERDERDEDEYDQIDADLEQHGLRLEVIHVDHSVQWTGEPHAR